MSKARLIYLLLVASLFAYFLAASHWKSGGMSDGGGFFL
jgi:hypothetical protein